MTKSSAKEHIETSSPHWIEWLTGGLCGCIVIALLGWLIWDIYRYDDSAADFALNVTAIEPASGGFRVAFDIRNVSQSTAAQVHVVGDLQPAAGAAETADVTFDYVASESRDRATLFFTTQPSTDTLRLRVAGYTEP